MKVCLDTNRVIYLVESNPTWLPKSRRDLPGTLLGWLLESGGNLENSVNRVAECDTQLQKR